jgi:hypothetical protein
MTWRRARHRCRFHGPGLARSPDLPDTPLLTLKRRPAPAIFNANDFAFFE